MMCHVKVNNAKRLSACNYDREQAQQEQEQHPGVGAGPVAGFCPRITVTFCNCLLLAALLPLSDFLDYLCVRHAANIN